MQELTEVIEILAQGGFTLASILEQDDELQYQVFDGNGVPLYEAESLEQVLQYHDLFADEPPHMQTANGVIISGFGRVER